MKSSQGFARALSVFAVVGVVSGPLGVAPGCGARKRAIQERQAYALTTNIKNSSAGPVVASFTIGKRTATAPGIESMLIGQSVSIPVGQQVEYQLPAENTIAHLRWEASPDRVTRLCIETVGASWESTNRRWFEVVGPVPELIEIVGSGDGVAVQSEKTRIEPVPAGWEPSGR